MSLTFFAERAAQQRWRGVAKQAVPGLLGRVPSVHRNIGVERLKALPCSLRDTESVGQGGKKLSEA